MQDLKKWNLPNGGSLMWLTVIIFMLIVFVMLSPTEKIEALNNLLTTLAGLM